MSRANWSCRLTRTGTPLGRPDTDRSSGSNRPSPRSLINRWIRDKPSAEYSSYGYAVYLSNAIRWHLHESGERDQQVIERSIPNLSPVFVAAAWELCRRGVIRPGVRQLHTQSTEHGSAGEGYSITPFGAQWAAESDRDDFVPTEPQRF